VQIIDDDFLRHKILRNTQVVTRFPFLSAIDAQVRHLDKQCQSCTGNYEARKERTRVLNEAKQQIASMSQDDRLALKQILNLGNSQLVLPYRIAAAGGSKTTTAVF
jgi:hypothetical protein